MGHNPCVFAVIPFILKVRLVGAPSRGHTADRKKVTQDFPTLFDLRVCTYMRGQYSFDIFLVIVNSTHYNGSRSSPPNGDSSVWLAPFMMLVRAGSRQ